MLVSLCFVLTCFVTFYASVAASPLVQPQTHTVYFMARKAALLPCYFSGFPRPSVYWTVTHSSKSINVTNGTPKILRGFVVDQVFEQQLTVYQNGTLHISEVLAADSSGQFQCTAVNRLGLAKGAVILTLVGGRSVSAIVSFITSLIVLPSSLHSSVRPSLRASVRSFVRLFVHLLTHPSVDPFILPSARSIGQSVSRSELIK